MHKPTKTICTGSESRSDTAYNTLYIVDLVVTSDIYISISECVNHGGEGGMRSYRTMR